MKPLLAIALALFAFHALARIRQPIAQDDLHWRVAAEGLVREGFPGHYADPSRPAAYAPHLYLLSVAASFRALGVGNAQARIPGIAAGLASVLLVFLLARRRAREDGIDRAAAAAALLYAGCPLAAQAALNLDLYGTVLVPIVLLWTGALARFLEAPGPRRGGALAVSFAAALWTSPAASLPLLLVQLLWLLGLRRPPRVKGAGLAALAAGAALFSSTWAAWAAAIGFSPLEPLRYLATAFRERGAASAGGWARTAIALALWTGPFAALFLAWAPLSRLRERMRAACPRPAEDLFLLSGLVAAGTHLVLGGAIFGFPKFHVPALALLCVAAVGPLARKLAPFPLTPLPPSPGGEGAARRAAGGPDPEGPDTAEGPGAGGGGEGNAASALRMPGPRPVSTSGAPWLGALRLSMLAAAALPFLVACVVSGPPLPEPIYAARFVLRDLQAEGFPVWTLSWTLSTLLALFALGFWAGGGLATMWLRRAAPVPHLLLAATVGTGQATCFLQDLGGYQTGYAYGATGVEKTAAFVRASAGAGDEVIAPQEIAWLVDPEAPQWTADALWTDRDAIRRRLEDPRTAALVYGIPSNTVEAVRLLRLDPGIREVLQRRYARRSIGTYDIWIRRERL